MHGLKVDRRRLRTRRCGVGHIDARHPGAVEHQPLCTLWAGRAPEGMALNSAHRRGVGFDLHQAHRRAARYALHHAPPIPSAHMECIGRSRCQAPATDCAAAWPRRHELRRNQGGSGALMGISARSVRTQRRLQLPMGSVQEARDIAMALPGGQARKAISADWQAVPLRFRPVIRARCGGPCTRSHASASPPEPGSAYWFDFEGCRLTHPLRPAPAHDWASGLAMVRADLTASCGRLW